jgi:GNAT superfamily N-acetyltransferase
MPPGLLLGEQDFDRQTHDRESFGCGVAALDEYLKRIASQHRKRNIAAIRVLVDLAKPETVIGYYTLSAAAVDREQLLDSRRLPSFPIPVFLLGRLAVDLRFQGQGYGGILLAKALQRSRAATQIVGAHALMVDAKDAAAERFYLHFGFAPCRSTPRRMYLILRD